MVLEDESQHLPKKHAVMSHVGKDTSTMVRIWVLNPIN